MTKKLAINFSYKPFGNTSKNVKAYDFDNTIKRTFDIKSCSGCGKEDCSINNCIYDSVVTEIMYKEIMDHDEIHFFIPVYLNMPVSKFMALMSRFSSPNDNTDDRMMFKGKKAVIHMNADVSGTQMAGMIAMNALNMIGFEFEGRAIREIIWQWSDGKIRGGDKSDDKIYIKGE